MAILNCLWIGGLAGLVASRFIRHRSGVAPVASSMAVGVLGAMFGNLAEGVLGSLPYAEFLAEACGAVGMLAAWALAHRLLPAAASSESPAEGR